MIEFPDFERVEIRAGTILSAQLNPKARRPAYELQIDFGPHGIKTSSAQITQNHRADALVGTQVVAVMNFAPKRVAGVKSEVLVLASVSQDEGTVLLRPSLKVTNGARIG